MTEITIFDKIMWGDSVHPRDIEVDIQNIYWGDYNDHAEFDTLRELVEAQNCNWYWFCHFYNKNCNDEKWGEWPDEV